MFAIIGILLVFRAVIGGFLMEKGQLAVLVQPAEFLIIVGAGLGTLLIANPMHILKGIFAGAMGVFGKSHYGRERYLSLLKMMFELLNKVRRAGMLSIEMDIEKPEKSVIFNAYPDFIHDLHVRSFVCDTMRMAGTGGVGPFDMDQMLDLDIEVQHRCANQPISALTTVADSLPGLGIVAAVLGVVITMGALGGPHEAMDIRWQPLWQDLPRHSAVLRPGRPHWLLHGQGGRSGACLPLRTSRSDDLFHQGECAGPVRGNRAPGHSHACKGPPSKR